MITTVGPQEQNSWLILSTATELANILASDGGLEKKKRRKKKKKNAEQQLEEKQNRPNRLGI